MGGARGQGWLGRLLLSSEHRVLPEGPPFHYQVNSPSKLSTSHLQEAFPDRTSLSWWFCVPVFRLCRTVTSGSLITPSLDFEPEGRDSILCCVRCSSVCLVSAQGLVWQVPG